MSELERGDTIMEKDTPKYGEVRLVMGKTGLVVHTESGACKHLTLNELGGVAENEELADAVLVGEVER